MGLSQDQLNAGIDALAARDTNFARALGNVQGLPQPPLITNCSRMDKEFDRCLECQEGFFLEAESTKCRAKPAGIVACVWYKDEFTCVECEDFYYPLRG